MKRKIKYILIFVNLLTILFLPASFKASNNTIEAYMININPGENANNEMRISWHMDLDKKAGKIIYTEKVDTNWEDAITIYPEYVESSVFHSLTFLHYKAILSDLTKDTEYMFQVGEDYLSEIYYFKTAGKDDYSFVLTGDWHVYENTPKRIDNAIGMMNKAIEVEPDVDFILSVGDIAAYGGDYNAWRDIFAEDIFKNYMWVNTIGNHDVMNNVQGDNTDDFFKDVHNYPENGYSSQVGKTYYFKYGNSLFFVLNNEDMKGNTSINEVQTWMAQVIDNNPSLYIFVSMHYNFFSGVSGANYQYNNWRNFFDEHQVDLAMSGHNHVYVRTNRLFQNETNNDKGTLYIQPPSADGDRGRDINANYSNKDLIAKRWTEGSNTVGSVIVNVNNDYIQTRLIDRFGNVVDEVVINAQKSLPELNKEEFKDSLKVYKSDKVENSILITANYNYIGLIDKIEYLENDNLIYTNNFIKKTDAAVIINEVTSSIITAKIYFKDKTVLEKELKLAHEDFYKVKDIRLTYQDDLYLLNWSYDEELSNIKAWIFINDMPYKEINLKTLEETLGKINITDKIEIRPFSDSNLGYYEFGYNTFGDVNLDGVIDFNDVKLIQEYLLGDYELIEDIFRFLDIDNDKDITLYDMSYIHLYVNELIDNINFYQYKIIYLDMFGNFIKEEYIQTNEKGNYPEFIVPNGYKLNSWTKDINNISRDLTIIAVLESQGGGL